MKDSVASMLLDGHDFLAEEISENLLLMQVRFLSCEVEQPDSSSGSATLHISFSEPVLAVLEAEGLLQTA